MLELLKICKYFQHYNDELWKEKDSKSRFEIL